MSAPLWVWKGPSFQRYYTIGVLTVGAMAAAGTLIWSLAIPEISLTAVLLAAVTCLGAALLLLRAISVAAIAHAEYILFRGIGFRREFSWDEIDEFSISTRVQRRVLSVQLKNGSQYLIPNMLQYKQVSRLEELCDRFEAVRQSALSGADRRSP